MKKYLSTLTVALVALLCMSMSSKAGLALRASSDNGATWTTVMDNDANDFDSTVGSITWAGSLGVWSLTVDAGTSMPAQGSATAPYIELFTQDVSTNAGTLLIELSETDFTSAAASRIFTNVLGGTTDGTTEWKAYMDAGNGLFAETTQLFDQGPFSTGSFSTESTVPTIENGGPPFSLTLRAIITHTSTTNAVSSGNTIVQGPQIPGIPSVGLTKQIACLQPTNNCSGFGNTAEGFKGLTDPAFCYLITITNSGTLLLTNVTVTDSLLGDITTNFFGIGVTSGTLAPGQVIPAYFKMALDTTTTNFATINGLALNADGSVNTNVTAGDNAVAIVDQAGISCAVTLYSPCDMDGKKYDNHVTLPGCASNCPVTFNIQVVNTGNANLTNVTIVAPSFSGLSCTLPPPFDLPVGASTNISCTPLMSCPNALGQMNVTVNAEVDQDTNHCAVYDITSTNQISVTSECSGTVECGPEVSSLYGTIFLDCAGTALPASPSALSNVTVTLEDSHGTVLTSTTTDKNGIYAFGNLSAGTYIVVVTPPAGYVETFPSSSGNNKAQVVVPGCSNTEQDFGYADKNAIHVTFPPPQALGCNPTSAMIPTDAAIKALVVATDDHGTIPSANITVTNIDATNGCSGSRLYCITVVGNCSVTNKGTVLYTWTVDTTPPAITCPPDITISNAPIVCTTYMPGDYCNYGSACGVISNCFKKIYPSGYLQCGVPSGGYCVKFTGANYCSTFEKCSGTPSCLKYNYSNPGSCEAGSFGSQVLCLKLNVDCGDNKSYSGFSGGCGDLVINDSTCAFNGYKVRDVLNVCHYALGGGDISGYGCKISDLCNLCSNINCCFENGQCSSWCKTHIIPPTITNVPPSLSGTPTVKDNCDSTPTVTYKDTIVCGACPNTYTIERTWTATDDCGNYASCTQNIFVGNVTGSVCGYVFRDCNGDGILTPGIDMGISNIVVTLKNSKNMVIATNTTDSQGSYCFYNLPAGTYTVSITSPANSVQTAGCHTNHWMDNYGNDCWNENDGYQHCKAGGVDCWTTSDGCQHHKNSYGQDCWTDKYGYSHVQSCTYTSCNVPKGNVETFTLASCENKTCVNFSYQGTSSSSGCSVSVSGPSKGVCGQSCSYTCKVTNTGNCCYNSCQVTCCGQTYTCPSLSPGQSCSFQCNYTCKYSDYGNFKCQASASCNYYGGSTPCTASSSCYTQVGWY